MNKEYTGDANIGNGDYFDSPQEKQIEKLQSEIASLNAENADQFTRIDEVTNMVGDREAEIKKLKAELQRTQWGIVKVRDELVKGDSDEAYHQLYKIADPEFKALDPWKEFLTSPPVQPVPVAGVTKDIELINEAYDYLRYERDVCLVTDPELLNLLSKFESQPTCED